MKIVSIDLETTGLDPNGCDIIEFAAIYDDLGNRKPLEELPRFHCYVDQHNFRGEPYALAMHSKILNRIAVKVPGYLYIKPHNIANSFILWLKKTAGGETRLNAAGKNFAGFDKDFLLNLRGFHRQGAKLIVGEFEFRQRMLDPAILFSNLAADEKLADTVECCSKANIEFATTHTALDDALTIVKLFRYCVDIQQIMEIALKGKKDAI